MRWIGVVLSLVMAGSFALPWIDNTRVGSWSLLDGVRSIAESSSQLPSLEDLSDIRSPAPDIFSDSSVRWVIGAFAVSFPLAALFTLIGLFGYYSRPMAFLLGGIPVGLSAYAGVSFLRLREQGFLDHLPENFGEQIATQAQANLGSGLPAYLASGGLLFLAALFGPSRR